jgi:EAL domain-containing protein (putative c-di-GMP-specific phosphodiesterase class I)
VIGAVLGQLGEKLQQRGVEVAFNLSGNSLNDGGLLEVLRVEIRNSHLRPEGICVEIAETTAVHNFTQAKKIIVELKRLGVNVALDDFGNGLSFLRYLKAPPVDYLKIDGSFVQGMLEDSGDQAIVVAINQAAHVFGLETIAEFAHSEGIVQRLTSLGVDYAQGYALGRPEAAL